MGENKEIVKYHNDMNEITFQKFGQVDFDFFMVLCSKLRDSGDNSVVIPFSRFKELAGYSPKTSDERFINDMMDMNYKQLASTGTIREGRKIKQFVLFTEFVIDPDEKTITASVNPKYKYFLNDLTKSFTRFELQEFVSLDSKYAKTLYRLLKQYRTTGIYITALEEFKRLIVVPKSYTNMRIYDKIIKPSVKALQPYFKNLTCEVQYERKRGRPVKGYKFTFTPEQAPKQIPKQADLEKPAKQTQKPKNSFHNFDQRTYDYKELEKKLLNRNRPIDIKVDVADVEIGEQKPVEFIIHYEEKEKKEPKTIVIPVKEKEE